MIEIPCPANDLVGDLAVSSRFSDDTKSLPSSTYMNSMTGVVSGVNSGGLGGILVSKDSSSSDE